MRQGCHRPPDLRAVGEHPPAALVLAWIAIGRGILHQDALDPKPGGPSPPRSSMPSTSSSRAAPASCSMIGEGM